MLLWVAKYVFFALLGPQIYKNARSLAVGSSADLSVLSLAVREFAHVLKSTTGFATSAC